MALLVAGSVALGGDHGRYAPVYLVPVSPVTSYAPAPAAYAPAPVAYAPGGLGYNLFHKHRTYAYPTAAAYAPAAYAPAAYAPAAYAPAAYAPSPYVPTAYAPAATQPVYATNYTYAAQAPPTVAAAPPGGYRLKWVKDDSGEDSGSGFAPGSNSDLPTFTDLTGDQNDKIRRLARESLSNLSGMSNERKKSALTDSIKEYYATEAGVDSASLSSSASTTSRRLAVATVNRTSGSSPGNDDNGDDKSNKVYLIPAPTYQLYLPVVPVKPGHFHKGY